ncbi:MAG: hypothetical protein WCP29_01350 [Acidobacteriota bacterium]
MATTGQETKPSAAASASPVIVDLGKKRKKLVKQLLDGEGALLDEVSAAIAELKAAGTIGASAQPVIVVVRPIRKNKGWMLPFG